MIIKKYNLREKELNGFMPTLTTYITEDSFAYTGVNRVRPAVIVLAGGAYSDRCPREAEPVALMFSNAGFHAFVVDYSIAPTRYPAALYEVCEAIKLIRKNADKWYVNPNAIAVCGFSAGGHLAASTGTIFDDYGYSTDDEVGRESFRPDFMILCYPVITMDDEYTNMGTKISLLGENAPKELSDKLSCEKRVTKEAAPAFIWHTAYDNGVHVYNSMRMAEAMRENGVEFALSIFRDGPHGLGLAEDYVDVRDWTHECELWMKSMKIIED